MVWKIILTLFPSKRNKVFLSIKQDGFKVLHEGDEVEFEIAQGKKGLQAIDVVKCWRSELDRKTLGRLNPGVSPGTPPATIWITREGKIIERGKMARIRRNFYRRSSKKKAPQKSYKATCAQCGKELSLEVPPFGEDLLCLDCYNKKKWGGQ